MDRNHQVSAGRSDDVVLIFYTQHFVGIGYDS